MLGQFDEQIFQRLLLRNQFIEPPLALYSDRHQCIGSSILCKDKPEAPVSERFGVIDARNRGQFGEVDGFAQSDLERDFVSLV